MLPFLDTHTHILPKMDDGAKDQSESVSLIDEMLRQDVHTICLTPHYYAYREPVENFLSRREKSFQAICNDLDNRKISYKLGAEIYLCRELFNHNSFTELAYSETRMALIELPFRPIENHTIEMLERFSNQYNLRPVIAHINRYDLFKNKKLRKRFREMGCFFQLNLEVFSEGFLKKRRAISLLKNGEIDFLGSDCHNMRSRKPFISDPVNTLIESGFDNEIKSIYNRSLKTLKF